MTEISKTSKSSNVNEPHFKKHSFFKDPKIYGIKYPRNLAR